MPEIYFIVFIFYEINYKKRLTKIKIMIQPRRELFNIGSKKLNFKEETFMNGSKVKVAVALAFASFLA